MPWTLPFELPSLDKSSVEEYQTKLSDRMDSAKARAQAYADAHKSNVQDYKERFKQAADSAKERASEAKDAGIESYREMAEKARERSDMVLERGRDRVQEAKDRMAGRLKRASLRRIKRARTSCFSYSLRLLLMYWSSR